MQEKMSISHKHDWFRTLLLDHYLKYNVATFGIWKEIFFPQLQIISYVLVAGDKYFACRTVHIGSRILHSVHREYILKYKWIAQIYIC